MEQVFAVCSRSKPMVESVVASDSGAPYAGKPDYRAPQKLHSRFPIVRSDESV